MSKVSLSSVGDKFPFIRLDKINSRFDKVINFSYEHQVVSLVASDIGSGPFRIALDMDELSSVQMLEYRAGCVILNDCLGFPVSDDQVYQSGYSFGVGKTNTIKTRIKTLKEIFLKTKPTTIMVNLLSGKSPKLDSAYDNELFSQFKQAFEQLLQNDFQHAVKGFKGKGNGLTPAGDDFNAGLLMGLAMRQQSEKKELSKIRTSIYSNSLGKNLLANTLLMQAQQGWYDEKWKKLLSAIINDNGELESALLDILAQGETSGADALTGFLAAWEIEIKG